ncbi:Hypothetical predicted protein [Mytilus galloprovincialis]|uniref:Prokineticin domain-containing protein n=1 Tax=Mytilus galloprovincialis TaxID=29158 RepID=A0A8B6FZ90_MYTGA|nr:Hypothetical predicted protein [Mytilus galloprovincialis]
MLKEICLFLVVSISIVSSVKVQCRHDTECGSDECCYYHEGPIVVSKKRESILPFSSMIQGGWCEKYKTEGQSCSGIAKMNGHCECGPGLTCTVVSTHTSFQKRKGLPATCVQTQTKG